MTDKQRDENELFLIYTILKAMNVRVMSMLINDNVDGLQQLRYAMNTAEIACQNVLWPDPSKNQNHK